MGSGAIRTIGGSSPWRAHTSAERYLERVIGRMIDVNYHVLTESGQAPPKDYYESFTALSHIGALDPEFATRIAACAGLRNRIVHEYEAIDPSRVHEAVTGHRPDSPIRTRGRPRTARTRTAPSHSGAAGTR
jgi:uncharacterized protein YutE (UPF0331/DUF86 family)